MSNSGKEISSMVANQAGPLVVTRTSAGKTPRRYRWLLVGGIVATLTALSACSAPGGGGWGGGWAGHGRHGGEAMSPEAMNGRIDKMVERVLTRVDATPEQKQKVSAIAKQTAGEMAPLREQHRKAREQAMALLAAPNVDRAALERIRAEQMQSADSLSKKVASALADIAEVLTPEQRAKLQQEMQNRRGRRGAPA